MEGEVFFLATSWMTQMVLGMGQKIVETRCVRIQLLEDEPRTGVSLHLVPAIPSTRFIRLRPHDIPHPEDCP